MRMSCLSTSRSLFSIKLSVQAYSEGLQFEAFYKAVTLIFAFQHELKQRQAVGMINRAKGGIQAHPAPKARNAQMTRYIHWSSEVRDETSVDAGKDHPQGDFNA